MIVLNVGGGTSRVLPHHYKGWDQHVLDIDPAVSPDVLCDAKQMRKLAPAKYDAVFCSHNLEHFYRHEVPQVLTGFVHVLKDTGFAQVVVPDLMQLFECITKGNNDIDDVWYQSPSGPIKFHDVLYGHGALIANGNQFYAHKCGFSEKGLSKELKRHFKHVFSTPDDSGNLHAFAFKSAPTKEQRRMCQ